ncbi:MAG: hypothetical protein Q8J97_09985, partial [Flavobacteriaceae bacterium]|nr:hypothetical protein [Flavobacteriaceae bacterium]
QNLLQNTIAIFNDFSRTMEDETSRMLLSLMTENKELWMSLNKTQFELDKAQAELAQARTRSGVGLNEHEYLQQQIVVLEQNIAAAHTTIEEQTKAQQRAEDALRRMVDEHQIAKQRGDQLQVELDAALAALEEREREGKEAAFESEQALQQAREVQKLNEHQNRQITSLTEQLHTLQETYGAELRSSVRNAQADRDAAIEACNKLRGELEDALARLVSTERELESRTAFFNNFKVTTEENHAQYIRSLQDDIAHHKALYERELEDMRRELQEKSDEVFVAMKEAEAERTGRLEAAAALRALDEQAATLAHERTAATEALQKSEERAADLQASL